MNQDDDADADARDQSTSQEHRPPIDDDADTAVEVLRDPESDRVTFAVSDNDAGQKLTEWMTIDPEHVVAPDEMQ